MFKLIVVFFLIIIMLNTCGCATSAGSRTNAERIAETMEKGCPHNTQLIVERFGHFKITKAYCSPIRPINVIN